MKYGPKNTNGADNPMLPAVLDRAPWQARIDQLPVKEKAHTRAGDALATDQGRMLRPRQRRLLTIQLDCQ